MSRERKEWLAFAHSVKTGPDRSSALKAQFLISKYSPKHKPVKPAKKDRLARKGVARASKKEERAAVRALVDMRAGGECENCYRHSVLALEFDHFYGRRFESVETCWMLCRDCHRAKTENSPTRADWDMAFKIHCRRLSFPFKPRFTKDTGAAARSAPKTSPAGKEMVGHPPSLPLLPAGDSKETP